MTHQPGSEMKTAPVPEPPDFSLVLGGPLLSFKMEAAGLVGLFALVILGPLCSSGCLCALKSGVVLGAGEWKWIPKKYEQALVSLRPQSLLGLLLAFTGAASRRHA